MQVSTESKSTIVSTYRQKTPGSEQLFAKAANLFPSGVTHDSRYLNPYGIYVERARGSHKWDVDGNRYIDYFGGHGALLLGHNHPRVVKAVHEALERGTHFGANHALEVGWADSIRKLIPSAERVRFTSSGTEATLMAVRLVRAFAGRNKIVRLKSHFHGWNDHMSSGFTSHFDGSATAGVLSQVAENVLLLSPRRVEELEDVLSGDPDVAAVLLEPTGSLFGKIPLKPESLLGIREITRKHGVLLILDEVVTGFRVSPGGAQALYGVSPDLTTLAKVLAGGLPGGAVVGRKEVLDRLDFKAAQREGYEKIQHAGTFNANPVSAAAGIAALELIATTDACERANAAGARLREMLNEVLEAEELSWAVYGDFSAFHIFTDPGMRGLTPSEFDPFQVNFEELITNPPGVAEQLRLALLIQGVDIAGWPGGTCSAAHSEEDLEETTQAFRESIRMLKGDGVL